MPLPSVNRHAYLAFCASAQGLLCIYLNRRLSHTILENMSTFLLYSIPLYIAVELSPAIYVVLVYVIYSYWLNDAILGQEHLQRPRSLAVFDLRTHLVLELTLIHVGLLGLTVWHYYSWVGWWERQKMATRKEAKD